MVNSEEKIKQHISNQVKQRIKEGELTARKVSELADMSDSTLSKSLAGKRNLTVTELTRIAFALNTTPDQLLPTQWPEDERKTA